MLNNEIKLVLTAENSKLLGAMKQAQNAVLNFGKTTEGSSKKASNGMGKLGQFLTGTASAVAGSLITKSFDMITNSIDGAIKRVDTMNNFPKVMSSLGVSAEKSTSAINKVADGLKGLPTTLDSATLSVQRFVAKNGDVEKSADMFLAVNNAILAGGAPIEV